jgi:hypothetical protein
VDGPAIDPYAARGRVQYRGGGHAAGQCRQQIFDGIGPWLLPSSTGGSPLVNTNGSWYDLAIRIVSRHGSPGKQPGSRLFPRQIPGEAAGCDLRLSLGPVESI